MTNIEKLESAIRTAIPELMEVTEVPPLMKKTMGKYHLNIEPTYKYDVTLLHLLRWLGEMEISCKLSPVDSINAILLFKEYTIKHYDTYHVHLELSKPLLRDQSDDVIEELVKILK